MKWNHRYCAIVVNTNASTGTHQTMTENLSKILNETEWNEICVNQSQRPFSVPAIRNQSEKWSKTTQKRDGKVTSRRRRRRKRTFQRRRNTKNAHKQHKYWIPFTKSTTHFFHCDFFSYFISLLFNISCFLAIYFFFGIFLVSLSHSLFVLLSCLHQCFSCAFFSISFS